MLKATTVVILAAVSGSAAAADSSDVLKRDVNQERRIEQGLKSGQLTPEEAACLERGEARIDKMEAKALSDGKLTPAEKQRIEKALDQQSKQIYREKHDAATADPSSVSSKRMQADVERNVRQEQRIQQGVASGQLNNKETAELEAGQARIDRKEARAGADDVVGPREQKRIQAAENKQSRRIHHEKHEHRHTD